MAQLPLWREIVSELHERTKPLLEHHNFLRERFEKLESEGFIWSKESMFDIFVQFGLSESPHDSSPIEKRLLEPRDPRGIESTSIKLDNATQIKKSEHTFCPLGLMNLPIEIFDKILETLDSMAKLEAKAIFDQRSNSTVVISGPGDRKPYKTYLHRNSPILNSIQNFSLTSREIYQRCRPWLWRTLKFPTSLPAPIDLWTKDILLKQGSYVRSLSLKLSGNCCNPPGEFTKHDPFYDNLIPEYDNEEPTKIGAFLSPENVRCLIHRCPNLSALVIEYDFKVDSESEYGAGSEAFLSELVPLLSNLRRLRHLKLRGGCSMRIANEFSRNILAHQPLFESLTLAGFPDSVDQQQHGDDSLEFNLSKIKCLSRLHIWGYKALDTEWCLYNWPKTITDLAIRYCDLSRSSAHLIIQHIAPYVTKLKLDFGLMPIYHQGRWQENLELDSSWSPETRFSLPFLTDLELSPRDPLLLDAFQDCKSLGRLKWTYRTSNHCTTLNRLILEAKWPELKNLVVTPHWRLTLADVEHPLEEFEKPLDRLEEYCEQATMKTTIRWPSDDPL